MRHFYQIEWASVESVRPDWVDTEAQVCRLSSSVYWRPIPTVGLLAVSHSQEWEGGIRRHLVKVSAFLQDCHRLLPLFRCAFRLVDGAGNAYLLGYADAPMPLVLLSDNRPDSPAERAARTLSISAEIPLLKILNL